MICITDNEKNNCCGCTACVNICPQQAIKMVEDFEGFLYPQVDAQKCVNCGLCDKVCPILNKSNKNNIELEEAYSLRCKNREVLKSSTSGGFFTPLAEYVINKNGIVYGVGFDKNLKVCHKSAENKNDIQEFRGSKYVQSYLGEIFKNVKENLNNSKLVLFSGTPCQVEGLKRFLMRDYDNLITVDLICHGTPSPKLWKKYVEFQEKRYNSKIMQVSFRNKTYGYHSGTMKLVFENGKVYYGSARVDYMLKSFFKEISSRPSCYNCKFKSKNHISDFTIYDCWSIEKLNASIKDDDLGYTNIIVNSLKGKKILDTIKNQFEIYPVELDKQIKYDGIMVEKSAVPNEKRAFYYLGLNENGIEKNVKTYINVTKKDYIIEKVKIILYKTKILNFLKKIRKK